MAIKISGSTIIDDTRAIVNADKIGIGQTTPRYDLEIFSTGTPTGIAVSATSTQTTDTNKAISIFNNSSTLAFSASYKGRVDASEYYGTFKGSIDPGVSIDKANTINITDDTTDSGTHYVGFVTATDGYAGVEVDSTGLVYKDGKLGIGTHNPTSELTVRGTILKTRGDSGIGLVYLENDGSFNGQIAINQNAGVTKVKLSSSGSSYFTGGNLGIGTPDPQQKVHLTATSGDGYFRADTNVNGGLKLFVQGTERGVFANDSAFSGSITNLGIAAKGDMVFRTGTSSYTERLRITGIGSVGIGTDLIEAPLHVAGANSKGIVALFGAKDFVDNVNYNYDDATIGLQGENPSGTYQGAGVQYITRNPALTNWHHGYTTFDRAGDFHVGLGGLGTTKATDKITILSGGKVGVGTTNPTSQLQVYRATQFASNPIIQARSNNGSTNELKFEIDGDGRAYFNGKVGIGITNPTGIFDIREDNNPQLTLRSASHADNGGGRLNFAVGVSAAPVDGNTMCSIASTIHSTTGGTLKGDMKFYTNGGDDLVERMIIKDTGKVGIGTNDPQKKLEVYDGDIYLNSTDKKIFLTSDYDQYITANAASNYLVLGTGNDERVRINSDGDLLRGGTGQDIGASDAKWDNIYAETVHANIQGTITPTGSLTITDDLTVNGNTTLGNETADSLTVNASSRFIGVTTFINDEGIFIKSSSNGPTNGAQIKFSDYAGGNYAQIGHIKYKHSDGDVSPGTNEGFIIGGSETLSVVKVEGRVLIDEKVGIGTITPDEALDVNGAIRLRGNNQTTYAAVLKANYDSTHTLSLESYHNSGTAFEVIGTHADGGGANVRVAIAKGGQKVGIGTDNPGTNLHVKGTGTDILKIESTDAGTQGTNLVLQHSPGAGNMADNDVISLLQFAGVDDSNNPLIYSSIRAVATDVSNNSEKGDLTFFTRNGSDFLEKLRITSAGNVGINETAPSEKLQIDGDILLGGQANSSESNYAIKFEYNNHQFAKIVGDGRDSTGYGDIDFYTSTGSGVSNLTQRMTIRADGKVGIGSTIPTGKLDVTDGTTGISFTKTSQNPHIDFKANNVTEAGKIKVSESSGGGVLQLSTKNTSGTSKERLTIDVDGRVLIGNVTNRPTRTGSSGYSGLLQLESEVEAALTVTRFGDAHASRLNLQHARGTIASIAAVQEDDDLGQISFSGWDSDTFTNAAEIRAEVDGEPGDDDMPGRLIFSTTPDNGSGVQERLRIDKTGNLTLQGGKIYGEDNAANSLHLQSTSGNTNHSRIEIGTSEGSDNGGIHFYTAGASVATRRITIKGTSGDVGIGTDDPTSKLHVFEQVSNSVGVATILTIHSHRVDMVDGVLAGGSIRFLNSDGNNSGQAFIDANAPLSYSPTSETNRERTVDFNFRQTNAGTLNTNLTIKGQTGRVGIGTDDPQTILHLHDSANTRIQITDNAMGAASGDGVILGLNGDDDFFINNRESSKGIKFFTGSDDLRLHITSDGSVNIGGDYTQTTDKFQVTGNVKINGNLSIGGTVSYEDVSSIDSVGVITARDHIKFANSGDGIIFGTEGSSDRPSIIGTYVSANDNHMVFNTTGDERVRINSTGQVSVGNEPTSGQGLFNVKPSSGDEFFKIRDAGDFDASLNGVAVDIRNAANSASKDLLVRSQNLVLWQSGDEKLRIMSDGRIGINTATVFDTNTMLQVNGKSGAGPNLVLHRNDTSVSAGQVLGALRVTGNDSNGTQQESSAIEFVADLDHATDDKPGRISFKTTNDGESSATEKLRIDENGGIILTRASLGKIVTDATDKAIYIAGGNDTNVGGNINLFGSTHASHANHIRFRNGGTVAVEIDESGRLFTGASQTLLDSTAGTIHIDGGTSGGRIALRGTTTSAETGIAEVFAFWNSNKVAGMVAKSGTDTTNKDDGSLHFYTSVSGPSVQERLRITKDGKVGINTTSNINGRLHVQHVALTENILYATRYNDQANDKPILAITEAQMTGMSSSGLIIGNHNRDIHIGPVFNSSAAVDTSDATGIRINSGGEVLIGTTTGTGNNLTIQDAGTSTTAGENIVARFQSNGSGRDATIQLSDNVANSATISMLSSALIFKQSGTETVRITSSGDVGIGTDDPTGANAVEGNNTTLAVGTLKAHSISGAISGTITNATNAAKINVADKTDDTNTFLVFTSGATGNQEPHTNTNLTFNSTDGALTLGGGVINLGTADSSSGHINSAEVLTFNIDTDNDDTNRYFAFYKNSASGSGTELVRITESGKLCIAHDDALHSGNLQVSTSSSDAIDINAYSSTAANGGRLTFYRSKNASIGSNTVVANDDSLGRIDFRGYNNDGNTYNQGATIEAEVDGAVNSSTDMPTAILFKTSADGSASPAERLRITSAGEVRVISSGNNNDPAHLTLHHEDTSIVTDDAIGKIRFAGRDSGGSTVSRTGAQIQATAAATWDTGQTNGYAASHLDFFTQSNSGTNNISGVPRLRITKDGNVGIGTDNPTGANALTNNNTTLAVGTLKATTITGDVAANELILTNQNSDSTCFPVFVQAITENTALLPHTNSSFTFNASTAELGASILKSTIATGTAPFTVSSTTKVTNLNADLLDDKDTSDSGGNNKVMVTDNSGNTSLGSGTFTTNGLNVNSGANFNLTTDATSSTNGGSVTIDGGAAIAKKLFVGSDLTVGGTLTYEDVTNVSTTGIVTAATFIATGGTVDSGTENDPTNVAMMLELNDYIYSNDNVNSKRKIIGKSKSEPTDNPANFEVIEIGQTGTALIDQISIRPGNAGDFRVVTGGATGYPGSHTAVRVSAGGTLSVRDIDPKDVHFEVKSDKGMLIRTDTNTGADSGISGSLKGAKLLFSDQSSVGQVGHIVYKHADGSISPNTNEGFLIGGNQGGQLGSGLSVVKVEGRVLVDEKVGIGTDNPLHPLHISSEMGSSPSFIHMQVTGSNIVGGGGGIAFDTSASNSDSNNSSFLATIAGIRNSANNGSNDLVFSTTKANVGSNLPVEKLRITMNGGIAFNGADNYGSSGQILKSNGDAPPTWVNSSTISGVDVKQYKVGSTERSCTNPITVSSGTIGISSASNAFGARYISTEGTSGTYCDGDIWYDISDSDSAVSGTEISSDIVEANKFFQNPTSLTETTSFPASGTKNGGVFGPYTIANGVTLTINSGSTFTVL